MNYAEYKTFSRTLLERESTLVRLDCMNPVKSLSALRPMPPDGPPSRGAPAVIAAWREAFALPPRGEVILGAGVRDLLGALFRLFAAEHRAVLLPNDVYPEYARLAAAAGLAFSEFSTWPAPRLPLDDRASVLVLPNPLVPVGRALSEEELSSLLAWLAADPRRLIVIDGVYTFAARFPPSTLALLETQQAVLLHSLAKGHLAPDVAGFALCPPSVRLQAQPPQAQALATAGWLLERAPDSPAKLQRIFDQRWADASARLGSLPVPASGYFSTCAGQLEALLESKRWLTVPSSVFGSPQEFCVITCLLA